MDARRGSSHTQTDTQPQLLNRFSISALAHTAVVIVTCKYRTTNLKQKKNQQNTPKIVWNSNNREMRSIGMYVTAQILQRCELDAISVVCFAHPINDDRIRCICVCLCVLCRKETNSIQSKKKHENSFYNWDEHTHTNSMSHTWQMCALRSHLFKFHSRDKVNNEHRTPNTDHRTPCNKSKTQFCKNHLLRVEFMSIWQIVFICRAILKCPPNISVPFFFSVLIKHCWRLDARFLLNRRFHWQRSALYKVLNGSTSMNIQNWRSRPLGKIYALFIIYVDRSWLV